MSEVQIPASPKHVHTLSSPEDTNLLPYNALVKIGLGALLILGVAACSATDPVPSPLYDGYYSGVRGSDRTDVCGLTQPQGTTSARVVDGRIAIPLFTPKTQLAGTVGEGGSVRASGIWSNPTGGFPGVTVLNGTIKDNVLQGTASDFRCHTNIRLEKVVPSPRGSVGRAPARTPPR